MVHNFSKRTGLYYIKEIVASGKRLKLLVELFTLKLIEGISFIHNKKTPHQIGKV